MIMIMMIIMMRKLGIKKNVISLVFVNSPKTLGANMMMMVMMRMLTSQSQVQKNILENHNILSIHMRGIKL